MGDILNMGEYGQYIWPAYGLVTLVLVALLVASRVSLVKSETLLRALQDSDPRRRKTPKEGSEKADPAEEAKNET